MQLMIDSYQLGKKFGRHLLMLYLSQLLLSQQLYYDDLRIPISLLYLLLIVKTLLLMQAKHIQLKFQLILTINFLFEHSIHYFFYQYLLLNFQRFQKSIVLSFYPWIFSYNQSYLIHSNLLFKDPILFYNINIIS